MPIKRIQLSSSFKYFQVLLNICTFKLHSGMWADQTFQQWKTVGKKSLYKKVLNYCILFNNAICSREDRQPFPQFKATKIKFWKFCLENNFWCKNQGLMMTNWWWSHPGVSISIFPSYYISFIIIYYSILLRYHKINKYSK